MKFKELNDLMEFGHVIRVESGNVTEPDNIWAPDIYVYVDAECQSTGDPDTDDGWELLRGYTGQYSYRGPVMHASEFIGSRLERDILNTDGYYCAVAVECPCDDDGCEPHGWAVAHMPLED